MDGTAAAVGRKDGGPLTPVGFPAGVMGFQKQDELTEANPYEPETEP
jgi:hypothetical protein